MPKTITQALLADLGLRAASAPRLRTNHNLHPTLDDPVQRFLNAIEPASYVRPHRHLLGERWELFAILSGQVAVLLFDENGQVLERVELCAGGSTVAIEIPAGAWHTLAALQPGSVLLEVKPGPYAPVSDKDFAPWAPPEGGAGCAAMRDWFARALPGERCPAP